MINYFAPVVEMTMTDFYIYDHDRPHLLAWKLYPINDNVKITDEDGKNIFSLCYAIRITDDQLFSPSGRVDSHMG